MVQLFPGLAQQFSSQNFPIILFWSEIKGRYPAYVSFHLGLSEAASFIRSFEAAHARLGDSIGDPLVPVRREDRVLAFFGDSGLDIDRYIRRQCEANPNKILDRNVIPAGHAFNMSNGNTFFQGPFDESSPVPKLIYQQPAFSR